MVPAGINKDELRSLILAAGAIVRSYYQGPLQITRKSNGDMVTSADIAVEQFLMTKLNEIFVQAGFYTEESGKKDTTDYCWVIDPIDGTTNFIHAIPYFCISVALTYKQEPILALIYQPITDELFYAEKNKGVYCNDKPIRVSSQSNFSDSFWLLGLPYSKDNEYFYTWDRVKHIAQKIHSFRHLGAVALDQAYVAAGKAEGLFFMGLSWWDVAAGILMIQEAGGVVSTFEGELVGPTYRSYLGSNKTLYSPMKDLLSPE